jgi:hypothetical protein
VVCDIDRRENLSKEDFYQDYVSKGRPVLVSGLLDDWPGTTTWSRKGLLESAAAVEVVTVMLTSQVSSSEQKLGAANSTQQTLAKYISTLDGSVESHSEAEIDEIDMSCITTAWQSDTSSFLVVFGWLRQFLTDYLGC